MTTIRQEKQVCHWRKAYICLLCMCERQMKQVNMRDIGLMRHQSSLLEVLSESQLLFVFTVSRLHLTVL